MDHFPRNILGAKKFSRLLLVYPILTRSYVYIYHEATLSLVKFLKRFGIKNHSINNPVCF